MNVRRAELGDMPAIMEVINQNLISLKESHDQLESTGFLIYPHTLAELESFIRDRENYEVLVAEVNNKSIGYSICCELQMMPNLQAHLSSLPDMRSVVQLKALYLKQIAKAEGTIGVGSILMDSILKRVTEENYYAIVSQIAHLLVRNTKSISFHEKFGFSLVSTIEELHGVTGVYFKPS